MTRKCLIEREKHRKHKRRYAIVADYVVAREDNTPVSVMPHLFSRIGARGKDTGRSQSKFVTHQWY